MKLYTLATLTFLGMQLGTAQAELYWGSRDDDTINKANSDGSGAARVVSGNITELDGVTTDGNQLYWIDGGEQGIYRTEFDGTGRTEIFELTNLGSFGPFSPSDITTNGSSLFWADGTLDSVYRTDMHGNNLETLVDLEATFGSFEDYIPDGIVTLGNSLYWADKGDLRGIYRSDLDGSNATRILDLTVSGSNNYFPAGLTGDENYLYWADDQLGRGSIYRANLDGSNPVLILDTTTVPGSGDPTGIVMVDGELFWTDSLGDALFKVAADGSNPQDILGPSSFFADDPGPLTSSERTPLSVIPESAHAAAWIMAFALGIGLLKRRRSRA